MNADSDFVIPAEAGIQVSHHEEHEDSPPTTINEQPATGFPPTTDHHPQSRLKTTCNVPRIPPG
jgi:hypothetical protein